MVPGLLAQGGDKDKRPLLMSDLSPTSRQNLAEALHESHSLPPPDTSPHATPVSGSPDPKLNGRIIYMMAILMPNITSFSGNWIIWFAERNWQSSHRSAAILPARPCPKGGP